MKMQMTSLDPRIESAVNSVVGLTTRVPEDAMTASLLGTERTGHGIVIREDIVLTIGYLIAEADQVWINAGGGRMVPGFAVGYDTESGFGIIRALEPLKKTPVEFGSATGLQQRDWVIVADSQGKVVQARIAAKQEFAGRWEYLLDEAIYTVPAVTDWAGVALFDLQGRLCGVGSLLVNDGTSEEARVAANMFVPIDILPPILEDLITQGRRATPPRPWLGLFIQEQDENLQVAGVYRNCPSDNAGVKPGDIITDVAGEPVSDLADFFRRAWKLGPAGTVIPLTVMRAGESLQIPVASADRASFFHKGTIN